MADILYSPFGTLSKYLSPLANLENMCKKLGSIHFMFHHLFLFEEMSQRQPLIIVLYEFS